MIKFILASSVSLCVLAGSLQAQEAQGVSDLSDANLLKRLDTEAGPAVATIKHLDPAWVASLAKRGEQSVYRGTDLQYIGLPIGGITCGQMYLSGDGRLYLWDIFNQKRYTGWDHYVTPMKTTSTLDQGFSVRIHIAGVDAPQIRALDQSGFSEVSFRGEYPIGHVEFQDPACPLTVALDAFSPFIPLNVDDSSLPLTVMSYTLTNTGTVDCTADVGGWLENQVSSMDGKKFGGLRINTVEHAPHLTFIQGSTSPEAPRGGVALRPTIVFDDFERDTYAPWVADGTAFGSGPAKGAPSAGQTLTGYHGHGVVDSWNNSDASTGTLTSPSFTISRSYISFLIGGGNHPGETCINLIVDDKVVRSVCGADSDAMDVGSMEVSALVGKSARLQIVDRHTGGWGHIDIDQIEFTDELPSSAQLVLQPDFGTMGLGVLEPEATDHVFSALPEAGDRLFGAQETPNTQRPIAEKLVAGLSRTLTLKPHQSRTVNFVIAWSFPNQRDPGMGQYYAVRFPTALKAASYLANNFTSLAGFTKRWHDTWYGGTLPYWLLDRTLINASILATSTAHRFANGNLWGWEGVGNCDGTCTHVWSYEQTMGRLFPELDINLRERTDYNPAFAFHADGQIANRGNHEDAAVDGQAGTILRTYRDHLVSPDNAFLTRNWPHIKLAEEWLIHQDTGHNGLLITNQRNTLDAQWFGEVAWLSSLYLASLHASEAMARDVGDTAFAATCHELATTGSASFTKLLFNGEYFQNRVDPQHPESINSGSGCEIDQVFGQGWAFQLGLGRIIPAQQTRTALESLFRYNFTTDAGAYRKINKPGRIYAVDGESGLLMCTFPKPDWNYAKAGGKGPDWAAGYFNECMNGFEHQAASHMIWEGLVAEGLAVERAVNDRYSASKRNPYNEMECGEHYARSMASYGVFLAACGFSYDGPKGSIGFDPRLTPEDFSSAFTSAEGWGTYSQKITKGAMTATLTLVYGSLRVKTISLGVHGAFAPSAVTVTAAGTVVPATVAVVDGQAVVTLGAEAAIAAISRPLTIALK